MSAKSFTIETGPTVDYIARELNMTPEQVILLSLDVLHGLYDSFRDYPDKNAIVTPAVWWKAVAEHK